MLAVVSNSGYYIQIVLHDTEKPGHRTEEKLVLGWILDRLWRHPAASFPQCHPILAAGGQLADLDTINKSIVVYIVFYCACM